MTVEQFLKDGTALDIVTDEDVQIDIQRNGDVLYFNIAGVTVVRVTRKRAAPVVMNP